jgi:hypothetical protein
MVYFVEYKSCHGKIVIERETPGANTVVTGGFTTFPRCPGCGAECIYGPSDLLQSPEGRKD